MGVPHAVPVREEPDAGRRAEPDVTPDTLPAADGSGTGQVASLISALHGTRPARLSLVPGRTPQASGHTAIAGELAARLVRLHGIGYEVPRALPTVDPLVLLAVEGTGVIAAAEEELRFAPGDVMMPPPDRPYAITARSCTFTVLQVPAALTAQLAGDYTGHPAAGVRFTSIAPVSAGRRAVRRHHGLSLPFPGRLRHRQPQPAGRGADVAGERKVPLRIPCGRASGSDQIRVIAPSAARSAIKIAVRSGGYSRAACRPRRHRP